MPEDTACAVGGAFPVGTERRLPGRGTGARCRRESDSRPHGAGSMVGKEIFLPRPRLSPATLGNGPGCSLQCAVPFASSSIGRRFHHDERHIPEAWNGPFLLGVWLSGYDELFHVRCSFLLYLLYHPMFFFVKYKQVFLYLYNMFIYKYLII